ncbi:ATP-binding cassette domain-containing protein [Aerococcus agrisoli]|uniref:ATP-binding cassette domain-containing protein n=1 Tax=Aerococcus agrisoli TaxID=2487350 RepID=A0A3N4GTM3_9LACT|nr:ATP-binding cassette domain-containing protein [Aerococcus agrisoli]RPA62431.1 ATP-binding cassette domain-containing protein [Aerococcus agrisoli]
MTSLLEISQASKIFNKRTPDAFAALDDLSLTVEKGDFITIVGGNGAGKSTLLNAIAGTFLLDSGSIQLNGQDITRTAEEDRAKLVSRVFQDPSMGTAPRMTVEENLSLAMKRGQKRGFGLALKDGNRQLFQEALSQLHLGLENRLDAEIGLLSGGQRQAIALLMATIVKPEILLLDEHTAALDAKTSKRILEISSEQVDEHNLTALMITHNLQDALIYGNRMILLHHGKIIRDFSKAEKDALTAADLYQLMADLAESDYQDTAI